MSDGNTLHRTIGVTVSVAACASYEAVLDELSTGLPGLSTTKFWTGDGTTHVMLPRSLITAMNLPRRRALVSTGMDGGSPGRRAG